MTEKVIIDIDPGIGDAVALCTALLDPVIDLVGVTATAGCVSGGMATRNAQALVELVDPPKWPRMGSSHLDAPVPVLEACPSILNPAALNGRTGLGDQEFYAAELHHPHESAKVMIELVRNHPHEVTILTLGPLTNIAMACERFPEFLGLVKRLVCLGGAIHVAGDITATSEFNIYADPEAARIVLRSPATKILVPLGVSSRAVLTYERFDRLANAVARRFGWLWDNVLPFALRAHHEQLGLEGFPLHAIVALASIVHPALFESQSMAIDVETQGELTRGMTVCDQRGIKRWQQNIDVLCDLDAAGVLDYFERVVC